MRRCIVCVVSLTMILVLGASAAQADRPKIFSVEPDYTEMTLRISGQHLGRLDPQVMLFDPATGQLQLDVVSFETMSQGRDMQEIVVSLPDDCRYMSGVFRLRVRRMTSRGDDLYTRDYRTVFADVALYPDTQRSGSLAGGKLYEVHRRVLWDLAWTTPNQRDGNGFYVYNEHPRELTYGNQSLFLAPLEGYGAPEVAPGATRMVRLWANYGHQWMSGGTPTIVVGPVESGIHFELPTISGHYGAQATNWSNFVTYDEELFSGHKTIEVFLKDYYWDGPHCGEEPGADRPKGSLYRVEAVFYDVFEAGGEL